LFADIWSRAVWSDPAAERGGTRVNELSECNERSLPVPEGEHAQVYDT